jgi:hypothetical protein
MKVHSQNYPVYALWFIVCLPLVLTMNFHECYILFMPFGLLSVYLWFWLWTFMNVISCLCNDNKKLNHIHSNQHQATGLCKHVCFNMYIKSKYINCILLDQFICLHAPQSCMNTLTFLMIFIWQNKTSLIYIQWAAYYCMCTEYGI